MSSNQPHPRRIRAKPGLSRLVLYALLLAVAVLYIAPLLWMFAVSVNNPSQASTPGLDPLPTTLSDSSGQLLSRDDPAYWAALADQAAGNYAQVWNSPLADFPLYLHNSAYVTLLGVLGMTTSSAVAAYGFSRLRWPGRNAVFVLVVISLMIPQAVLLAPQYVLFKHLGLIGTLIPLWLPCWFGGAFSIFLLRQFFLSIPRELDEAAMLDGCSHLGVFLRIILPVSKPVLAVVALTQAIVCWNDFLGPLLFLNHQDQFTLALGLQMYQSQHGGVPWNLVMAASTIVVIPVLILYIVARRFLIDGIATQAMKG